MAIEHEAQPDYRALLGPDEYDDHWLKVDAEENLDSRPPFGERVLRPVLMLTEAFVGGDLEGMVAGCRDLGFADEWVTGRTDVYTWASQVRRSSRTGSWVDIGVVVPQSGTRPWFQGVTAEIPDDFERVHLRAYSPTPSVVFLVATFDLTSIAAARVDEE